MGKKWQGWRCGGCKRKLHKDELTENVGQDGKFTVMHAVARWGDRMPERVIPGWCGPVRH